MDFNSYKGITLTSIVSKVLEFLLSELLELVFLEGGLPHIKHSTYRCAVSCLDPIFANQQTIARYLWWKLCLHVSIQFAESFDSVEYPVLGRSCMMWG